MRPSYGTQVRIAKKNGICIEGTFVGVTDELSRRCLILKSQNAVKYVFVDEIDDFECIYNSLGFFIDQILTRLSKEG